MRIYNCFPLFNELDLLEMRLVELDGLVDRFVIVEAAQTFSGRPKPMLLKENMDRFARFADRIQRVEIAQFPEGMSDWDREFYQFDQTLLAVDDAGPDDLILASDADEILSAETLRAVRANPPKRGEVLCLELRWFWYYVNLEHRLRWIRGAPRVARRADVPSIRALRMVRGPVEGWARNLMRGIKASRYMRRPIRRRLIRDAGWHFAWLGGVEAVTAKALAIPQHANLTSAMAEAEAVTAMIDRAVRGDDPDFTLRHIGDDFPRILRDRPDLFARHMIEAPSEG